MGRTRLGQARLHRRVDRVRQVGPPEASSGQDKGAHQLRPEVQAGQDMGQGAVACGMLQPGHVLSMHRAKQGLGPAQPPMGQWLAIPADHSSRGQ